MTGRERAPISLRRVLLATFGVAATLTIFAADVMLFASHTVAGLYVAVVLVAGLSRSVKTVVWTTLGAVALTWLGALINLSNAPPEGAAERLIERGVNTVIIGLALVVVNVLVDRDVKNTKWLRALHSIEEDRAADKRMLAAASEIAAIGTWSIDVDDDRMTLSETAAEMHGFTPGMRPLTSEVLGQLDPTDAKVLMESVDAAWERGIPFREELRINPPGRAPRWVVKMGERVRLGEDSVASVHGTVQDITTWKQAELAASDQHNRLAQLTRSLPIIVWTADPQGNIEYFNDALVEYTGSAPEGLLGDKWSSAVDPRDLDAVVAAWTESLETGKAYDIEYRVRGADGVYRWHHLAAQPELDDAGTIVRWWGTSINVDANRHLREEADKLAADREIILESMSEAVCAIDRDWRIIYINSSAERLLSRTREELVGHVLDDVGPGFKLSEPYRVMERAMNHGTPEHLTYRVETLDMWIDISIAPSAVGLTIFARDITEVRRLSEQLSQSQRLEAIGQLTGGIAHDFNNLLTVVLGGADALADDDAVQGEAREMVTMIGTAAERGAELTHRLLAFARRQPLEPRSVDLSEKLLGLEPLLRRTLGDHIALQVTSARGQFLAEVDPGQFDNAVLNLAINARDAMPHGGALMIEVSHTTFDETYVTSHGEVSPGTYVVTSVTDSGEGISPLDIGKLFDPFFTTKEMGQGSGLGLAMVWGFVKQSGGHVTVYSETGQGSTFKIYLPVATTAAAPAAPSTSARRQHVASGKILVAEDDDLVRRFAVDRLRSSGYEVVEAGSGPEALEVLQSMDRVDLLFTDVIMAGGMTGRELADAVVELRPGTPTLYASGYTENVVLHNGRLDPGVHLLTKPYSAQDLLHRVGELILPPRSEAS